MHARTVMFRYDETTFVFRCSKIRWSKRKWTFDVESCAITTKRSQFGSKPEKYKIISILIYTFRCQEEDFETPEQYDDYLEEIENIIYNLVHNIDIINTNKRIEQYKRENRELILKNKSRLGREEFELEMVLEQEKMEDEQRRIDREKIEREAKKKKQQEKEALIDELMFSYEDASKIVDVHAKNVEKMREEAKVLPVVKTQTEFSTGVKFGQKSHFLPVPRIEEGPLYVYEAPVIVTDGPMAPTLTEIETKGYKRHIRWVQK